MALGKAPAAEVLALNAQSALVVSLLGYEVLRAAAPPLSSWERASHHRDLEFAAVDDIQATAV